MRIRSTKPEFWRSERVCSIEDWGTRLLLKGLESYVDDNGVGKDDLALIVADVFPRDLSRNPTGTLRRVSEGLDTLSEAGLLWRYEDDGTRLLYISFWESIQRIEKPTRGRFRRPDGTMNYRDSEIREPSGNAPVTLREPSGLEQRNRGTEEQVVVAASTPSKRKRHEYSEQFEEFWKAYPSEGAKDKPKAYAAWSKAIKTADPADIIAGAKRYALVAKPGYTKYAQGWLTGERWNDDPPTKTHERPRRASIEELMNR